MEKIKVAIYEDNLSLREVLSTIIRNSQGFELAGEFGHCLDAVQNTVAFQPDVILMDIDMPERSGIEGVKDVKSSYPVVEIIMHTVFEDTDKIFEAIKAGASGYLLKEDSAIHIVDAINSVYEHNGIPMSPSIARKTLELLKNIPVKPITENKELTNTNSAGLSEREIEILKEMVSGKNYKAIGEKLFISPLTVRKHASHIYEKLHVNNRTQAINIAQKQKWI